MDVLGLIGFVISLVLFAVKLWETFWQKPKFDVDFEWQAKAEEPTKPFELRVYIVNTGRKKGTIREFGFARQREYKAVVIPGSIRRELPVVIDTDSVQGFAVGVHPEHDAPIHQALHSGLIDGSFGWGYALDARRRQYWGQIPDWGEASRNPPPLTPAG